MLAKNHCIRLFLCQLFLVPFGLNLGLTMRHSFNPDCQSYSDYQGREHSPPSPPSPPRQDHPKDIHLDSAILRSARYASANLGLFSSRSSVSSSSSSILISWASTIACACSGVSIVRLVIFTSP